MSAPHRCDDLYGTLSDMEEDVRDLTRWAQAVYELGTSNNDPSECLLVIGPAMAEVVKRVEEGWERALNLSQQREGGR